MNLENILGKKSRTKGSSGELDVCKILSVEYPDVARELDQYQESLGRDLRECQPLCVQVKRWKTVTHGDIKKAFAEAESALDQEYRIPIVFSRQDYGKWRVTTTPDDLRMSGWPSMRGVLVEMSVTDFMYWLKQNKWWF